MARYNRLKSTLVWILLLVLLGGCAGQAVQEPEPAQTNPELARSFAREGQLALEQGRRNAAAEAWQKAVELDPGNAVVVNNLALVMKDQHRFAEAAKLLETGISNSPEVAELHYNLAVIAELYLLELDRALTHYNRYRVLTEEDDQLVTGWIADLERRLQ
ncbi:tetratricopeptide repeat protein [Marinobacter metalliresistant]|uniref:Tetratricopeptide repeat protein n=1 Tax=Marinobacter metalliresistant TaxID=2961995 RepID=A0ABZ2W3D0_9GAMM